MAGNGAAVGVLVDQALVQAPALEIRSLREALALFVTLARGAVVCVRHAAAMEALLLKAVRERSWLVPNIQRVASLAVTDHLLALGVDAHLRVIYDNPHDVNFLNSFSDWTLELEKAGRDVGGDFFEEEVCSICEAAREVVAGGLTSRRTEAWLREQLDEIGGQILTAKATFVLFADGQLGPPPPQA